MIRRVSFFALLAVFLVVGFVLGNGFSRNQDAEAAFDTVILVQGGHEYTLEDYNLFLFIHSSDLFEKFVELVIVRSEAESRGLAVNDAEIDEFVAENMVDKNDRNRYEQYQEIFDGPAIRRQIAMQVLESKLVKHLRDKIARENSIDITEDDARNYFLENISDIHQPARVEISLLSAKDREKCEEALKRLENGADFNELSAEMTDIPELARQGGYYGVHTYRDLEEINVLLADSAFSLQEGQWSSIIRGENHFHIAYIHSKAEEFNPTFDEIKGELMERMFEARLLDPLAAAYNSIMERGFDSVEPKVKLLEPKKPTDVTPPAVDSSG